MDTPKACLGCEYEPWCLQNPTEIHPRCRMFSEMIQIKSDIQHERLESGFVDDSPCTIAFFKGGIMLKPCPNPWCDGSGDDLEGIYQVKFAIKCKLCGLTGPFRKTPYEAEEAWNTRPEPIGPKRWVWDGLHGTCGPYSAEIEVYKGVSVEIIKDGKRVDFSLVDSIPDAKQKAQDFIDQRFWEIAEGGRNEGD
ncbi:hypothetical protein Dalk_4531 [Desulfatibacillum aliphaticivorans]|uniref:Uncharacterized protein n=1 Tax=Desulfatibacillum aliphaticivorans TaxID=218208 RepID=B8FCP6_DESAL|nr:hypothetical protein [Desulfatibacillum aliphaticivorans]ACL06209.1 hypothetical protein Dalk_4531 [Desulfatibacillum aliphaticivorans]